ncbi:hypothetical protein NA78x_001118 [Anatilimnocola sp. NA78]|uniref:DUF6924 domain-containing protein n=1 Tax=Anatilimnocola sp. NA78 TaxID=3415683 RepID=UPI003CE4E0B3
MNHNDDPWVIRTDFSNPSAWEEVCQMITSPQTADNFYANVRLVSDEYWRDKEPEAILAELADDELLFVVDRLCLSDPEHPVLVLGSALVWDEEANDEGLPPTKFVMFRALPSTIQAIENNVTIGNMGLEEFADGVDADGVFRCFSDA